MRNINRFKGCLLGGAVGDALGYTVEFMSEPEIFAQYGSRGITRYEPRNGKALISDDTQMTLFTAVGLLFGQTRGMMRGIGGNGCGFIRNAYLDWLDTQTKRPPCHPDRMRVAWLANFAEFYHRRAPGTTCMTALENGGRGTVEKPINHSKGCGGVMRVAPIGLYFCDKEYWTEQEIDMAGAEAAAITHGHELGYIPAAALVHIVHSLASGKCSDIRQAVEDTADALITLFPKANEMVYFFCLLRRAIELSEKDTDDLEAIHELGKGWVAEETLAIAVYCALKYSDDFEKAIIAAVNHGGDSDSTGAVTGNILGAYLGVDAIPPYYLENLELREIIEEVAEDLYNDCQMEEDDDYYDPIWDSKYIQVDYDAEKKKTVAEKR